MPSIVDIQPYPWALPEARELHVALMDLFPTGDGAAFVAQQAGMHPGMINANREAYMVWKDVLEKAANASMLRVVVERARDLQPTSRRRAFFDALLAGEEPVRDSDRRGLLGAPQLFRSGTDQIMVPEALLYHDDLTLPIGRIPWLIGVLETLRALAPSVCRFVVSRPGERQHGTGFRVSQDYILTNWHVLTFESGAATKVIAEFGYEDDGKGGGLASTAHECDLGSMVTHEDDDWGVIKTVEPLPDAIPIVKLSEAVKPQLQDAAFIIQHPNGDRKRIAYVRNQVTAIEPRVLHYLSDTQTGSSGSPVVNDRGRLIGLHHAGGRPQEVAGKPPMTKNEGICIPAVLEGLEKARIVVP